MPSQHFLFALLATIATLATIAMAKCPTDNTICMNNQCYYCQPGQNIRFSNWKCYCDDTPCPRCPAGAMFDDQQTQFGAPFNITGTCRWVASYDKSNTAGVSTTVLCDGAPTETVVSGTCQCDDAGDCTGSPRLGRTPGSSGWNCSTSSGHTAAAYALCCQTQ